MRRTWKWIVTALSFALLLGGCVAAAPSEGTTNPSPDTSESPFAPAPTETVAEYHKITQEEAREMMSGDVVVLDVRTQEEFDAGHIPNAVLLPDTQITEKAETVLPDKTATILVYCRSGRRSEEAARALVEMGYSAVYDFGGIEEWTGEIVVPGLDATYYNYFGGDLPPDITEPIDFTVNQKLSDELPEFTFRLEGQRVKSYGLNADEIYYYIASETTEISTLTVTCAELGLEQVFSDLETDTFANEKDLYGLSFDDWDFDGVLDISLWMARGGTMMNDPHYFWLWSNADKCFETNAELEELSMTASLTADGENKRVEAFTRLGSGGYAMGWYTYDGAYVLVKHEEANWGPLPDKEEEYGFHVIVRELIDGELVVTEDYYREDTV